MLNQSRKTIEPGRFAPRTYASDKSALAAFGGTRTVPEGFVVPWPAAERSHLEALEGVVASGRYHRVNHPIVESLEDSFASWANAWRVRAVGSGTAAIHIALHYHRRPGGKVVTAALNWPGAIGPIHAAGLQPEFVDVSLSDAALDPTAAADALDDDSAIVLVTHLFGNPAFRSGLRKTIRARPGTAIVDDCAQAIAVAAWSERGKGLESDAIALSANGAKHLGAGELGLLCARDQGLIDHVDRVSLVSSARNGERTFSPVTLGYNFRPNVFSAALARKRLDALEAQIAWRRRNADRLYRRVAALKGLAPLFDPAQPVNSFLSFPLRLVPEDLDLPAGPATRDFVCELLRGEGVPIWVWLRKPAWAYLPFPRSRWSLRDFPNTRRLLDTMFYVSEIAPPNDEATMDLYADAFEKVWSALPRLKDEIAARNKAA